MILQPGKNESLVDSYRPISLLPILSKLLEVLFQKRLILIVVSRKLILNHQFGFRKKNVTIEQVQMKRSIPPLTEKNLLGGFVDIYQTFDKVWHNDLMFKLKKLLPINYYLFLKSYLSNRQFIVRHGDSTSVLAADVPQGIVLGPIL